jgi:hypothetical protein
MATSEYLITIDSKGAVAKLKVKYLNTRFKSLELISGKFETQIQFESLLKLTPQMEQVILLLQSEFEGRVSWEKIEKSKPSLFTAFMDEYINWYESKFEIKPIIKPIDGAALKWIVSTISQLSTTDDESKIVWQTILSNWNELESFYQSQTELPQIKRNLNIILKTLKHGKHADQARRTAESVSNDYRSKFKAGTDQNV